MKQSVYLHRNYNVSYIAVLSRAYFFYLAPEPLPNNGEYQTAGIDEVELQMKDLIHTQKTVNLFNDITLLY
jgi:hypothetical protein